ncbi:MAG: hypothetical protein RI911_245 [Candidatus Parcubacteria bacterium]|jgi:oligoendopeptidase F
MQKNSIQTEWDLTQFYKSDTDPQIEQDMRTIEKLCAQFEKKYRGKQFNKNEKTLLQALSDFTVLHEKVSGAKPLVYFHYRQALNSSDANVAAAIAKLGERMTKAGNKLIFFDVTLAKTPTPLQKKFLKSAKLSFFKHQLENVFESGKYTLTEPEERILSLKSQTDGMWVDGVDRALNKRVVTFKDEQIPINAAIPRMALLQEKPDRDALWSGIHNELKTLHDFCESELNAFYTSKKISDELRGYKKPYSATLLSHEMDEKTVFGLRDAVNEHMGIARRFFALKKKMLGLSEMRMHDINAPLKAGQKKMTFPEAHASVRAAFEAFDSDYLRIYDRAFAQGHVDVFPKVGKGGGAFHSKTIGNPGVILLNQVDDTRSAFTIAHEMGHLVHSSLAEESQKPLYQDYSTATAEVASRFAERVYFEHLLPTLNKDEQIALRTKVLYEEMNNIFHGISDFNIEHRFYTEVYARGFVPFDEMCGMFVEENKKCFGEAVTMLPEDGYRVIYISHFRLRYYLYCYAFGSLVARALHARVKKDPAFITSVKAFMKAGSSKRPADIFKSVGIDIKKPNFFAEGLKAIEEDVAALEKLVSN